LIRETKTPTNLSTIHAFGTPTIVHFCSVLLVSAILSAPWSGFSSVAASIGVCGAIGVVYGAMIINRARRQTGYKPVLQDWVWHCLLPLTAYVTVLVAAILIQRYTMSSLFAIAAAVILLLFIGIHNAWDTVTYVIVEHGNGSKKSEGG